MFKVLLSFVSIALFCVALATPFYSAQAGEGQGGGDMMQPLSSQPDQPSQPMTPLQRP